MFKYLIDLISVKVVFFLFSIACLMYKVCNMLILKLLIKVYIICSIVGHDETMIAIALGYVCHLLLMISQFLNVPLRYSIHFYGSRSTITDHISSHLPEKTREYVKLFIEASY